MTEIAKLTPDPVVYEIGKDITQERYNTLVIEIGEWFRMRDPDAKEPMRKASRYLDACLKGRKPSDPSMPWSSMARADLDKRIRVACRWDMHKMKPLYTKKQRRTFKTREDEQRAAKMVRNRADDPHIPEAVRVLARQQTTYGDDPRTFLSKKEHENWNRLKASYMEQFPSLSTVNAEAELDLLCDLLVVNERLRFKILNGERVDSGEFKQSVDNINSLKKLLGIHPDQLAKRVQESQAGSFTELVARVQAMPDFREIREQYWVEELMQLYQMYHQPSLRGDMEGFQLDDVGLMGLTGCRTCACPGCGQRNFAGIKITEVEAYLETKGVLDVDTETSPPEFGGISRPEQLETYEPTAAERAEWEAELHADEEVVDEDDELDDDEDDA